MGKFFNGKVKKDRSSLIKYIVVGIGVLIIVLLFLMIAIRNKQKANRNVVVQVNDSVTIEVNTSLTKDLVISKVENYDSKKITIDEKHLDASTPGRYTVTVNAKGVGSKDIEVVVEDTTPPEMAVKAVTIKAGESYSVSDFVESCKDNSKKDCKYSFYLNDIDQNGNSIDYGAYTTEGTYVIKLVASDPTGNESTVYETTLTIGEGEKIITPTVCEYGNLGVSTDRVEYPIAVTVGDKNTGCALNMSVWNDENTQKAVNELYQKDYSNLKKEVQSILNTHYPKGADIMVEPHFVAVLNDELKGLVGYGVFVKVYITEKSYSTDSIDKDENLVLSYYLKSDLSRQYLTNKYNLK